jgi:hypothetical protein
VSDEHKTTPAKPVDSWHFRDADGRMFRVDDYGPGRVWVLDVMSPTGTGWWELREKVEGFVRLP